MIKVIVFDCDGVMFDSKPANQAYYDHLLEHFRKPHMDSEELDFVHTHNVEDCIAHIFRNHPDVRIDSISQYRDQLNYSDFLQFFKMEESLVPFLKKACQDGYQLAISTNRSDTMGLLLESFGLSHFYTKIMTATNATRPKPAPDAMLEILDHYSCTKKEVIFIGDSMVDYYHAKSSGVTLIGFKNPSLPTPFHITSFEQIWSLPIQLNS